MPENDHIRRLLSAIALDNDQGAYKELFILLHKPLKQFAYSILKSGEEAEELVSDVFIGIWQKKEKLTTIGSPLFYFYTTVKNLAITRLKKQKRQASISPEDWLVQMNSIYFDPEQLMMTEEMLRQVKNAVNELPHRCRMIFKMIKEDGLKYRETAELLHLSVKTVEAQMAIALRRVAKCMHVDLKPSTRPHFFSKK
ncbi:MAG TPA: RNA polymerase sigma-70 factor [Chitinophagaceae bacterium]|jgi:RNA polymerase sigma-70 factor (ECF subfamily)|nr:RNA polymerase sigma-70 factor [Chitinophagaceae bacterium]